MSQQQGGKDSGGKKGRKGEKGGGKDGGKYDKPKTSERTYVADGMPSDDSGCLYCHRPGHNAKLCPKKAAEKRGEVEGLLADFARTGAVCQICSSVGQKVGDHRARHHNLAAQDSFGSQSGTAIVPAGKGQGQAQQYPGGAGGNGQKGAESKGKAKGKGKDGKDAKGPTDWKSDAACKLFSLGKCTYGDRCRFSHAEAPGSSPGKGSGKPAEKITVSQENNVAYNVGPYITEWQAEEVFVITEGPVTAYCSSEAGFTASRSTTCCEQ